MVRRDDRVETPDGEGTVTEVLGTGVWVQQDGQEYEAMYSNTEISPKED